MIHIEKLKIPLEVITTSDVFRVIAVAPIYKYVDGRKQENLGLQGYRYTLGDIAICERIEMRILGQEKPIVTNEQLESSKAEIKARVEGAYAKPYRTNNGDYALSFTATKIVLV